MNTGPKKERLKEIDMLRGIAMFVMILIHTNAYFLSNKTAKLLWNASQFAVPVFIYCSAYLYFHKDPSFASFGEFLVFLKKRFIRLLQPYYMFAIVFTGILALNNLKRINLPYIVNSFMVVGGIDINWLVLLFLIFSFVMPFISYTLKKNRLLFYFFAFCSFASSFIFVFFRFPFNYRYIMWLPWSVMIIAGYVIMQNEKKKWFFPIFGMVFLVLFLGLRSIQINLNHSLIMYDNKYPPNLYHLSYGIMSLSVLYWIVNSFIFRIKPVESFFSFLSKYSYSLFFIHYTILFILALFFRFRFTWESFFVVVLSWSVLTQFVFNEIHLFSMLKRGPTI